MRSGPGEYGALEGQGGVFGTTGGGGFGAGMHVVERPVITGTERGEDENADDENPDDETVRRR